MQRCSAAALVLAKNRRQEKVGSPGICGQQGECAIAKLHNQRAKGGRENPNKRKRDNSDELCEILLRVDDPQSLSRCSLVCKDWNALISTPFFKRVWRSTEAWLLFNFIYFQPRNISDTNGFRKRRLLCKEEEASVPVECDTGFKDATIIASAGGLLCLHINDGLGCEEPAYHVVGNPLTRQWTKLPVLHIRKQTNDESWTMCVTGESFKVAVLQDFGSGTACYLYDSSRSSEGWSYSKLWLTPDLALTVDIDEYALELTGRDHMDLYDLEECRWIRVSNRIRTGMEDEEFPEHKLLPVPGLYHSSWTFNGEMYFAGSWCKQFEEEPYFGVGVWKVDKGAGLLDLVSVHVNRPKHDLYTLIQQLEPSADGGVVLFGSNLCNQVGFAYDLRDGQWHTIHSNGCIKCQDCLESRVQCQGRGFIYFPSLMSPSITASKGHDSVYNR